MSTILNILTLPKKPLKNIVDVAMKTLKLEDYIEKKIHLFLKMIIQNTDIL